ncbi:MAG: rhomboid family intramembrane serine protease [Planctomycetota bacterium]
MIPVGDDQGRRRVAVASILLGVVWIVTHLALWRADAAELAEFERHFGLDRTILNSRLSRIRGDAGIDGVWHALALVVPFVTYKLLHGAPVQVFCNVLAMYVFGGRLEQRAGALRFLLFHELAGAMVAVSAIYLSPDSRPMSGASGAVAASVTAYLMLHGRAKVRMLFPVVVWPVFFQLPALLVALGWVLMHVPRVGLLLHLGGTRAVGWGELAVGSLAGVFFIPLLTFRRPRNPGRRR